MTLLTHSRLRQLIDHRSDACVSIFLPARPEGGGPWQAGLRLKQLVEQSQRRLQAEGLSPADARRLLEPVYGLTADKPYWHTASRGLGVFAANNFFRAYRVPIPLQQSSWTWHPVSTSSPCCRWYKVPAGITSWPSPSSRRGCTRRPVTGPAKYPCPFWRTTTPRATAVGPRRGRLVEMAPAVAISTMRLAARCAAAWPRRRRGPRWSSSSASTEWSPRCCGTTSDAPGAGVRGISRLDVSGGHDLPAVGPGQSAG